MGHHKRLHSLTYLADSNSDLTELLSALSTQFSFHPAGVVFRPGRWKSYTPLTLNIP